MGLEGITCVHPLPPSHSLQQPWTPDASSMRGILTSVLGGGSNLGLLLTPSQLLMSPSPCQPPTVAALMPGCSGQQGQDKRQDQTKGADTQVIPASAPCPPPPNSRQSCLLTRGFRSQAPARGWLSAGVNLFQS